MVDKASDPVQIAIDTLNEAIRLDKYAIRNLVSVRVPCNQSLADHATIQVDGCDEETTLGVLGLINGIIENISRASGQPRWISAVYDKRLIEFCEYVPRDDSKSE